MRPCSRRAWMRSWRGVVGGGRWGAEAASDGWGAGRTWRPRRRGWKRRRGGRRFSGDAIVAGVDLGEELDVRVGKKKERTGGSLEVIWDLVGG